MKGVVKVKSQRRALQKLMVCVAAACLVLSGCAGAGAMGGSGNTVTIAMVSNSQMTDARKLASKFEAEHPEIKLKFITLSENQARAKITASTAMGGGEFDVVMISNYETPQWAENGWLVNLSELAAKTPGYDENDFIPSLRESLSYKGSMYSVPFYGESSFLMYRKDLFEQAGITLSPTPTWQEVADAAAKLDRPDMAGICLRGKPGWGEVLAPLDTVINTFGGRWFDENWNAQLTSPEVEKAVQFYVDLVRAHGEPGAGDKRIRRVRHTARAGSGRDVVRRDLGGVGARGPGVVQCGRQDRICAGADRRKGSLRLAVQLVAGHPQEQQESGSSVEVHLLDDQQAVPADGR